MQRDTFFSATIVTALLIVGASAVATVAMPSAAPATQRQLAAAAPATATLPAVLVIGKRETRIAATDAGAGPNRVQ